MDIDLILGEEELILFDLKENPLLSIVIPVYNTEQYVEKCLDSIFSQTYNQIEVIIVNNGSSGNIEEIVSEYRQMYPERLVKLVSHKENQGTFHGRGSGMTVATGKYFTFMDADDRVGVDYFYQMVKAAEQSEAEIVVTDLVHEDEDGKQFRYVEDPVRSMNFDIKGKHDVFDFYYHFQGLSYSMYGIWNKIYRRELWDRCKTFIDAIEEHFALCEDAAYTTIFFSQANHVRNIHDQYYYHFVRSDSASGSLISTVGKAKQNAIFQGTAFRNIKEHLKRSGYYNNYKDCFEEFRNFHLRVMLFQIENSNFRWDQKRFLRKFICDQFEEENPGELSPDEMFFTTHFVEQMPTLEILRQKIVSGEYRTLVVDVFNVALISSVWNEEDIYKLIQPEFEKITGIHKSFARMRTEAEQFTRKELEASNSFFDEVKLDEIYNAMSKIYKIELEYCTLLREKELKIKEKTFHARKIILELWDLAQRVGMKTYLIGNTVLPANCISKLVNSVGYSGAEKIILSSECRKNVVSQKTFEKIVQESEGKALYLAATNEKRNIDQFQPNVDLVYVPKTLDMLLNKNNGEFRGSGMLCGIYKLSEINTYIGIRTMLTQAANVFFDNPFEKYDADSNYNGEAYNMGYLTGGVYALSSMQWLLNKLMQYDIHKLVIVEQTGNVFSKVIKTLVEKVGYEIKIEEIVAENDKTRALPYVSSLEELYQLNIIENIRLYSPRELIEGYKYIFNKNLLDNYEEILEENSILLDDKFLSNEQYYAFVRVVESYVVFSHTNLKSRRYEDAAIFLTGMNLNAIWEIYGTTTCEHIFSLLDIPNLKTESYVKGEKKEEERIIMNTFFRVEQKNDFIGCKVILRLFQQGINDFVQDYLNEYSDYQNVLCMDIEINNRLMDNLLSEGKKVDRFVLLPFKEKCENGSIRISEIWAQNVRDYYRLDGGNAISSDEWFICYSGLNNKLKKFIFMLFFDHRILKEQVRKRLKNHLLLMSITRRIYHILQKGKKHFEYKKAIE